MEARHFSPLGDVRSVQETERGLLLEVGDEKFRVDVVRPDLLRLKISQAGHFDESPTFAASFHMPAPSAFRAIDGPDAITLETDSLRLVIHKKPFGLDAYRDDGSVVFEDDRDDEGESCGYLHLNDAFIVSRRIAAHDAIYGLGQKTGRFD